MSTATAASLAGRLRDRPAGAAQPLLARTLHPLLARVLAARGITSVDELELRLARLPTPAGIPGIDAACARLVEALRQRERIVVVGDYDADGATSTALAVLALRAFGGDVRYEVPNRFTTGYGLSPEVVDAAAAQGAGLVMTVDTGIASLAGVEAARARGIDVIVTDHHLPGDALPAAVAIVNPVLGEPALPTRRLAGVGVAFYLLAALRTQLAVPALPAMADLLDLVALGTVADLVPLDGVNRLLVAQGLARMRAGRTRPGIRALCTVAGRALAELRSADLGFALAPRLNAAGRLEDMRIGIECLLAGDEGHALELAQALDAINRQRRELQDGMTGDALAQVRGLDPDALPWGLCLFDAGWHQGIVGIVAGRIREETHRPVVAFAPAGQDADGRDLIKGSARSVPGLHIRDALAAIDARQPGLVLQFGGHAMAAGLTLTPSRLAAFTRAFDAEVRVRCDAGQIAGHLQTDGELAVEWFDLAVARALEQAGPWGQQFPEPQFHGRFGIVHSTPVGTGHLRLVLRTTGPGGGHLVDAIAFNQRLPEASGPLLAVFRLGINRWRGEERLQLVIDTMAAG